MIILQNTLKYLFFKIKIWIFCIFLSIPPFPAQKWYLSGSARIRTSNFQVSWDWSHHSQTGPKGLNGRCAAGACHTQDWILKPAAARRTTAKGHSNSGWGTTFSRFFFRPDTVLARRGHWSLYKQQESNFQNLFIAKQQYYSVFLSVDWQWPKVYGLCHTFCTLCKWKNPLSCMNSRLIECNSGMTVGFLTCTTWEKVTTHIYSRIQFSAHTYLFQNPIFMTAESKSTYI